MLVNILSLVFIATQVALMDGTKFQGFVPDNLTAVEVAKPILRKALGQKWIDFASPLRADLIMDRWVIKGTFQTIKEQPDLVVEPYVIAIDKWSARIALFGPVHLIDIRKELSKLPSDRPKN